MIFIIIAHNYQVFYNFTTECTFDTMWKNGTVGVASLSESDEMCQGYVWYYPVMDVTICGSTYPVEDAFIDFGITKYHK